MRNRTSDTADYPGPSAPSRRQFRLYVQFATAWVVVFFLLDPDLRPYWFLALACVGVVWVLRVSRCLRPDLRKLVTFLTVAAVFSFTGGIIRTVEGWIQGVEYPFPSIGDAVIVAAYVMFLIGILWIVRKRVRRFTLDPVLDALLGGIAVATVQWYFALIPSLRSPDLSAPAKAMNVVFAGLSLLLVAAAVLALVSGSKRSTSNRLLAAGLISTFILDMIATLATFGRLDDDVRMLAAPFLLLLGSAGLLHPSVVEITDRPSDDRMARSLSNRRILVLATALLAPPVLLVVGIVRGDTDSLVLPAVSSLVLAPLVVVRLGRLVHQNQELAALEAALRGIGEQLVSAESPDDVARIVTDGAAVVLDKRFVAGRLALDLYAEPRFDEETDLGPVLPAVREHIDGATVTTTGQIISLGELSDDGLEWSVGLVASDGGPIAALVLGTDGALGVDELNTLSQLCREAAIALRAVEHTELRVRRRSEERFGALIDNSSDIVAVLDDDLRSIYVSPVATRILGYEREFLLGASTRRLIHSADLREAEDLIADIRRGHRETVELRLRHAEGNYLWFEVVGVDLGDDPNIGGLLLNLREIGDRKQAEEQLVLSEARFKALVQNSTDMVIVLDPIGEIRYASPSVEEVIGQPATGLIGSRVDRAFADSNVDWDAQLRRNGATAGHPQLLEFTFRRGEDDHRTVETSIMDLRSEPAVGGFVLNARDVTDRKSMEHRLRYQATHDDLTGLVNRSHVVDELDGILRRNSGNTTVAVITLGLDDFKDVNDSLGHGFGDQLLVAVAERLKGLLSFGDTAGRVGGDQFVVVVERSHGESHVTELAERMLAAVALPYTIADRELTVTASAGIVFDHDRSSSGEVLLRNADTAMYRSKANGKRQVVVFEAHMHAASYDRMELRADLARAIASDQFIAHYQPILDIGSGRIVGAEALIRWNHPRRGMVGPNLFIPLAEDTGMIGALGEWILRRACTDLAGWRRLHGQSAEDLRISVNLSVHQLRDEYIVGTVEQILTQAGLPADRLVLEVTESTLITETDQTRRTMRQLRDLGAQLAVDDFGTGYSSLGYIQQFEFDILKIDKSFVDGLDTDTNRRIVTAVLDLAAQLEVRTVAEGIESRTQVEVLRELGCDLGQGFFYSRPVGESAFREMLAADRGTAGAAEQTQPQGRRLDPPSEGMHAKLT